MTWVSISGPISGSWDSLISDSLSEQGKLDFTSSIRYSDTEVQAQFQPPCMLWCPNSGAHI